MFQKILVCSDGSENAYHATQVAAEIARKFGSNVILLNVVTMPVETVLITGIPILTPNVTGASGIAEDIQQTVERRSGKIFDEAGIRYECRREMGHTVDRIVSVAEEEKVDLIVVGSRGLSGFKRHILGSVSDGVAHHAHCPVMIVR